MCQLTYFILIAGFILLGLLLLFTFIKRRKEWSFKALFREFNRKMWMTIFLGSVFFAFYVVIVCLSAYVIPGRGVKIFFLLYESPVYFIYLGLSLFASTSMFIYLIRMVIKYFYLTRGKDR
ncbi:MAG: LPXTG cell wall anchor domain-containing protein [Parachlamydiaceae bacterium]